jgi:sulfonate transport system ATP-binding protein
VRAQLLQLLGVELEGAPAAVTQPEAPAAIVTPFNFSNFSI